MKTKIILKDEEKYNLALDEEKKYVLAECNEYNLGVGTLKDGEPDCHICKNKRYVAIAEKHKMGWYMCLEKCDCQIQIIQNQRIKSSGLLSDIAKMRLDNFHTDKPHQKQIKEMAEKYLAEGLDSKKWFVILGQTGIGKTHICTAICGEAIKRNLSVKYLRWLVELRKLKMRRTEDRDDGIDNILTADVIYIDDLFKRSEGAKCTDADIRLAFELLDNARALQKIVLISSEDGWDELIDIDEAVAGRMRQMCGPFHLEHKKEKSNNYRFTPEKDNGTEACYYWQKGSME